MHYHGGVRLLATCSCCLCWKCDTEENHKNIRDRGPNCGRNQSLYGHVTISSESQVNGRLMTRHKIEQPVFQIAFFRQFPKYRYRRCIVRRLHLPLLGTGVARSSRAANSGIAECRSPTQCRDHFACVPS